MIAVAVVMAVLVVLPAFLSLWWGHPETVASRRVPPWVGVDRNPQPSDDGSAMEEHLQREEDRH